ncbi:MAG: hypothetical protein H6945_15455 [Zoogloeaceae bacterium]|nr:hypothetical protein [Rhodocyclaceae bacterium]MCP5237133.1 hypothetical protein [Zoogloeaceae bacterium]
MSADALPEDSVLRRHAETERNRQLGLPPTDSVLKRHYMQLQQRSAAPAAGATARATPRPSAQPAAPAQPGARAASAPPPRPDAAVASQPSSGGGLLGWLKRLLGA